MKAIFETDSDEVPRILSRIDKQGLELTAFNYAEEERQKLNL